MARALVVTIALAAGAASAWAQDKPAAPPPVSAEVMQVLKPCKELRSALKRPETTVVEVPGERDQRYFRVVWRKLAWIANVEGKKGEYCTVMQLGRPQHRVTAKLLPGEEKTTVAWYWRENEGLSSRTGLFVYQGKDGAPRFVLSPSCDCGGPKVLKAFDGRDTLFLDCGSCGGDSCSGHGYLWHAFDATPELVLSVELGELLDCGKTYGSIRVARKGAAPTLRVTEVTKGGRGETHYGRVGTMAFDPATRKFAFQGKPAKRRLPDPCPAGE